MIGIIKKCGEIGIYLLLLVFVVMGITYGDRLYKDRFRLWNECKGVYFKLETNINNKGNFLMELTYDEVAVTARSRLRGAGIYLGEERKAKKGESYVFVRISTLDEAFAIYVSFHKEMVDNISGLTGYGGVWGQTSIGLHYGREDYVINRLGNMVDKFIDEYLRVNREVC